MKKYFIGYIYKTPYAGISRTVYYENDDMDEVIKVFNAIEKGQLYFNGKHLEKYSQTTVLNDEEDIFNGTYWASYELYVPLEEIKGKEIS